MASVEVFFVTAEDARDAETCFTEPGWYYWYCFPGCLPDSELSGPFATEAEAEADCRDDAMNGCLPCPFCDLDAEVPEATPEADRCDYCAAEFGLREASK